MCVSLSPAAYRVLAASRAGPIPNAPNPLLPGERAGPIPSASTSVLPPLPPCLFLPAPPYLSSSANGRVRLALSERAYIRAFSPPPASSCPLASRTTSPACDSSAQPSSSPCLSSPSSACLQNRLRYLLSAAHLSHLCPCSLPSLLFLLLPFLCLGMRRLAPFRARLRACFLPPLCNAFELRPERPPPPSRVHLRPCTLSSPCVFLVGSF